MKHEIRMIITNWLLKWVAKIIPKNYQGYKLIYSIIEYLETAP